MLRDLTDPAEGPHAIQLLVDAAVDALDRAWGAAVRRHRRSPVVDVEDNYDRLRIPPDAVARDVRYSHYVDERRMLRGHTSAMIPPALRDLAGEDPAPDDVLLVCPGAVYRRDAIDRLHTGTPHQLDLWRVSRRARLGTGELDEMVGLLADALVPGRRWRAERRAHPYTLEGRQVDVEWGPGEWIEVWECGLAHPEVLARAGVAGTGLALGMGLDRLLMVRKGIPDIRLLRSTDPRVAGQLLDIDRPYRPVSTMPPVSRDVSVAVDADDAAEDLGDRVREALDPDEAEAVEEVAVLAETPYEDLPPAARDRLGIGPGQKNLLVRIVLRHLTRTLTDAEANAVRDRIYAALHAPM